MPAIYPYRGLRVAAVLIQRLKRRLSQGRSGTKSDQTWLVVKLDAIGDVVLCTPFLRELRHNLPKAEIVLVVNPQIRNLVELCPYVDKVKAIDFRLSGRPSWAKGMKSFFRMLTFVFKDLAHVRPGVAIIPRFDVDYFRATYLAYASGATNRVGYSEHVTPKRTQLNSGFDRLLTRPLPGTAVGRHEVEHNIDMLRQLGFEVSDTSLEIWWSKRDDFVAERILHGLDMARRPLVALAPGSGRRRVKQWPTSRFREVADFLITDHGAQILILGGPGEELLGDSIAADLSAHVANLVGRTTLRQTAALLRRCDLFIGNDSGPMHMAAAVRIPVVAIFGQSLNGDSDDASSPARFGPWCDRRQVVQPCKPVPPCEDVCLYGYPHCILEVSVEDVVNATSRMLAVNPPRGD